MTPDLNSNSGVNRKVTWPSLTWLWGWREESKRTNWLQRRQGSWQDHDPGRIRVGFRVRVGLGLHMLTRQTRLMWIESWRSRDLLVLFDELLCRLFSLRFFLLAFCFHAFFLHHFAWYKYKIVEQYIYSWYDR